MLPIARAPIPRHLLGDMSITLPLSITSTPAIPDGGTAFVSAQILRVLLFLICDRRPVQIKADT